MKHFKHVLSGFMKDESGQDLVEYALVVAMVATIAIAASSQFSGVITGAITSVGAKITTAITGS
jgi:pilus assembly protein Flp/PilA